MGQDLPIGPLRRTWNERVQRSAPYDNCLPYRDSSSPPIHQFLGWSASSLDYVPGSLPCSVPSARFPAEAAFRVLLFHQNLKWLKMDASQKLLNSFKETDHALLSWGRSVGPEKSGLEGPFTWSAGPMRYPRRLVIWCIGSFWGPTTSYVVGAIHKWLCGIMSLRYVMGIIIRCFLDFFIKFECIHFSKETF